MWWADVLPTQRQAQLEGKWRRVSVSQGEVVGDNDLLPNVRQDGPLRLRTDRGENRKVCLARVVAESIACVVERVDTALCPRTSHFFLWSSRIFSVLFFLFLVCKMEVELTQVVWKSVGDTVWHCAPSRCWVNDSVFQDSG